MQLIHALVSDRILSKVDRLFTNRLAHVFTELLQNARRAGATLVNITTTEQDEKTCIVFFDNGRGIDNFAKLLHLGDTGWDEKTERTGDAAGMGFFSLVHSGVDVASHDLRASITKEHFLGQKELSVEDHQEPIVCGTKLTFIRDERLDSVKAALASVATYGPIDVILNGAALPRKDFLADAVMVREFGGVRIGIFDDNDSWRRRDAVNFYGSVISHTGQNLSISDVLPVPLDHGQSSTKSLYARFDVIDTSCIRLKLPDRTAIVEDEKYKALVREARIAMFEYLASQQLHCAPYAIYEEAHQLGVVLKEASPWMRPFCVLSNEDNERFGEESRSRTIVDSFRCALVSLDADPASPEPFTFEMAFRHFEKLPLVPMAVDHSFRGYSWYDSMPVYRDFILKINGVPVGEFEPLEMLTVTDSIVLYFSLASSGESEYSVTERFDWELPFAGWAHGEWDSEPRTVITKDSSWSKGNDLYAAPFDLAEATKHVAFSYNDDAGADSYDTQEGNFTDMVYVAFRRVLGGPIAEANILLTKAIGDWNLRNALKQASITEVRLFPGADGRWDYELKTAA